MHRNIYKYKKYFTKQLHSTKSYRKKLNKYFKLSLNHIQSTYRNIDNIMRSSLIFYLFLLENDNLVKMSSSEIKTLFYLSNIIDNSIIKDEISESSEDDCSVDNFGISGNSNSVIRANGNLLYYHPLVVSHLDKQDKLVRQICMKIVLAIKVDFYNSSVLIDYYAMIEPPIKSLKTEEQSTAVRKNTSRGGTRKKHKLLKNFNNKDIDKNI